MIEIQIRDENGRDRIVATFDRLEDLFRTKHENGRGRYVHHYYSYIGEATLAAFGHHETQRTYAPYVWRIKDDVTDFLHASRYCYVALDNGRLITPDRLVGLYREFIDSTRRSRRHFGWGKYAYGGYRKIKTTNELRQIEAHIEEEDAPPIRCSRNRRNLPNAWDDRCAHNDKSWKTQSKRRHQWKDC